MGIDRVLGSTCDRRSRLENAREQKNRCEMKKRRRRLTRVKSVQISTHRNEFAKPEKGKDQNNPSAHLLSRRLCTGRMHAACQRGKTRTRDVKDSLFIQKERNGLLSLQQVFLAKSTRAELFASLVEEGHCCNSRQLQQKHKQSEDNKIHIHHTFAKVCTRKNLPCTQQSSRLQRRSSKRLPKTPSDSLYPLCYIIQTTVSRQKTCRKRRWNEIG